MRKTHLFKMFAIVGSCATLSSLSSCTSKMPSIENAKIGILQYASFDALDKAKEGFVAVLKEAGVKEENIDFKNAAGKAADQTMYAKTLADTCDLLLGIATPSAQALKGAEDNSGYEKPLLFTAVTDAVDAKLVETTANGKGFVCGTTDANPVEEQIALVKEILPNATKMGIIYTQTETNSAVQAAAAKAAAEKLGLEVFQETCTSSSDIKITAQNLVSKGIDAMFIPTDNNIAEHMAEVEIPAREEGVLLVTGEEGMLKTGGHISLSIDYAKLGKTTGEMAVKILKGEKEAKDFPVTPVPASDCTYCFSERYLADAGITIPEEVRNAHNWVNVQ